MTEGPAKPITGFLHCLLGSCLNQTAMTNSRNKGIRTHQNHPARPISACQNWRRAHLVWPPPPAGRCAEPGTSPHPTAPRFLPPPPTAGRTYSMSRCHTLRGRVSDHGHRICRMITRIRGTGVDKACCTQYAPTYRGRGTENPKFTLKCSTCKSV